MAGDGLGGGWSHWDRHATPPPVTSRLNKVSAARLAGLFVLVASNVAACQGVLGLGDSTVIVDGGVVLSGDGASVDGPEEAAPPADASLEAAAEGGQVPEASTPDADAGAAETGPDGGDGGDANTQDVGDAEAAAPGDGGFIEPAVGCAAQTANIFCADFDTSTDLNAEWDWGYVGVDGGVLVRDLNAFHSAPASAQVSCPPTSGDIQFGKGFSALASRMRVAFDVRIDMTSLSGIAQVGLLKMVPADPTAFNYVLEVDGTAAIEEYANGNFKKLVVPTPPLGRWTRLAFEYTVAGGLVVYEDGTLIASDDSVTGLSTSKPMIIVGGAFINAPPGTTPLTLEFDNVVVRGE